MVACLIKIKSIPAHAGVASYSSRRENATTKMQEQSAFFLSAEKIENVKH